MQPVASIDSTVRTAIVVTRINFITVSFEFAYLIWIASFPW